MKGLKNSYPESKNNFKRDDIVHAKCCKAILNTLKKEKIWLTFDELYTKAQTNCDCIRFALCLEKLVKKRLIRQILPYGSDFSYYKLSNFKSKKR